MRFARLRNEVKPRSSNGKSSKGVTSIVSSIARFVARLARIGAFRRRNRSGNWAAKRIQADDTRFEPDYETVFRDIKERIRTLPQLKDNQMQELRDVEGVQAGSLGPPAKVMIYTARYTYTIHFATRIEAHDLVRQLIENPEPQVLNGEGWVLNLGEPVEYAYLSSENDEANVVILAEPRLFGMTSQRPHPTTKVESMPVATYSGGSQ